MEHEVQPWSEEQLCELRDEVLKGTSFSAIAELTGRSRSSIGGKVRRLKEKGFIEVPKHVRIDRYSNQAKGNPRVKDAIKRCFRRTGNPKEIREQTAILHRAEIEAGIAVSEPKKPRAGRTAPPTGRIGFQKLYDMHFGETAAGEPRKDPTVDFFSLRDNAALPKVCRYIIGPVGDGRVLRGEKLYCGDPTVPNSPYCEGHTRLCYTTADIESRKRKEAKACPTN